MYPEDCVQSIISTDWWIESNEKTLCRGALVFAFAPLKMNFKEVPNGTKIRNNRNDYKGLIITLIRGRIW